MEISSALCTHSQICKSTNVARKSSNQIFSLQFIVLIGKFNTFRSVTHLIKRKDEERRSQVRNVNGRFKTVGNNHKNRVQLEQQRLLPNSYLGGRRKVT